MRTLFLGRGPSVRLGGVLGAPHTPWLALRVLFPPKFCPPLPSQVSPSSSSPLTTGPPPLPTQSCTSGVGTGRTHGGYRGGDRDNRDTGGGTRTWGTLAVSHQVCGVHPRSCMDASIAIKPVFERFQSVIITSGVSPRVPHVSPMSLMCPPRPSYPVPCALLYPPYPPFPCPPASPPPLRPLQGPSG